MTISSKEPVGGRLFSERRQSSLHVLVAATVSASTCNLPGGSHSIATIASGRCAYCGHRLPKKADFWSQECCYFKAAVDLGIGCSH